jgi:hypothetical protein
MWRLPKAILAVALRTHLPTHLDLVIARRVAQLKLPREHPVANAVATLASGIGAWARGEVALAHVYDVDLDAPLARAVSDAAGVDARGNPAGLNAHRAATAASIQRRRAVTEQESAECTLEQATAKDALDDARAVGHDEVARGVALPPDLVRSARTLLPSSAPPASLFLVVLLLIAGFYAEGWSFASAVWPSFGVDPSRLVREADRQLLSVLGGAAAALVALLVLVIFVEFGCDRVATDDERPRRWGRVLLGIGALAAAVGLAFSLGLARDDFAAATAQAVATRAGADPAGGAAGATPGRSAVTWSLVTLTVLVPFGLAILLARARNGFVEWGRRMDVRRAGAQQIAAAAARFHVIARRERVAAEQLEDVRARRSGVEMDLEGLAIEAADLEEEVRSEADARSDEARRVWTWIVCEVAEDAHAFCCAARLFGREELLRGQGRSPDPVNRLLAGGDGS